MNLFDSVITTTRELKSVDDVCGLIEDKISRIMQEVETLVFKCSPEDDRLRAQLLAQKDILVALKVSINSKRAS